MLGQMVLLLSLVFRLTALKLDHNIQRLDHPDLIWEDSKLEAGAVESHHST